MGEKQKQWYWLIRIFIALLSFAYISIVYAQDDIKIICASSTPQSIQANLPGTYFHLISSPYDLEANSNYRFEAISASGIKEFALPLSRELSLNLFTPSLSPDGRYMAFRPTSADVGLTIWDLQTDTIASLKLQPSDLKYLTIDFTASYQRNQNLLVWSDNRHLLLNYYDRNVSTTPVDWIVARKIFTVQKMPFQIIEGKRKNFDFPTLPLPANSITPRIEFSPSHRYVTQLTEHLLYGDVGSKSQFEIFDAQRKTRVYNIAPTIEHYPVDRPVWMPDESTVFILTSGEIDQGSSLRKVTEMHTQDNFSDDQSLQQAIVNTFGAKAGLTSMSPVVSPSGRYIMFGLYVIETEKDYLLRYEPNQKQLTAFCDLGPGTNNDETFSFWYPKEQYFAYYNNGQIYVSNLVNGTFFTLPSDRLFVGWSDRDIFET